MGLKNEQINTFSGMVRGVGAWLRTPEFRMLLCMLLLLRVNLVLKLAGIVICFLLEPDFRLRLRSKRIPLFYPAMASLVVVQMILNAYRGTNYLVVAALACGFWIAGLLVVHQLAGWCERYGPEKVRRALAWFFMLNALATFATLVRIMIETGTLNPYQYVGEHYKYFASTGDHLRGITGDISTVNMVLNVFGTFYFLYHRNYFVSLLCFLVALVTTSNVGNFVFGFFLFAVLVVHPSRLVKSIAVCYIAFLVTFIVQISPSNLNYLNNKITEIFRLEKKPITIRYEDHREKDKMISDYIRHKRTVPDTTLSSKKRISYLIQQRRQSRIVRDSVITRVTAGEEQESQRFFTGYFESLFGDTVHNLDRDYYSSAPGKLISFRESVRYALSGPRQLLIGAGAGNFSSRIAYKATNLGFSGRYVEKLVYIAPEFRDHHLKLTLRYYMLPVAEHSVINFPNSVFNQLLGEYGLAGIILFLTLYVWFFIKRFRLMQSARILFFMLMAFLLLDYWFESMSIVLMFELMAFSEINPVKVTPSIDERA